MFKFFINGSIQTQKQTSEGNLRSSDESFKTIVERVKNGEETICIHDLDGSIVLISLADLTQKVRQYAEGSEEYKVLKRQMPSFTPIATFPEECAMNKPHEYTGMTVAVIRAQSKEEADKLIEKAKTCPYTLWIQRGTQENLVFLFMPVEGFSDNNFEGVNECILNAVEKFLGHEVLKRILIDCKVGLNYDPDVYVNPNPEVFNAVQIETFGAPVITARNPMLEEKADQEQQPAEKLDTKEVVTAEVEAEVGQRSKGQKVTKVIIPSIISKMTQYYTPQDDELQRLLTLSSLVAFGSFMSDVTLQVKPGETIYPTLYLNVVAAAASGKGILRIPARVFNVKARMAQKEFAEANAQYKEWEKCQKKKDSTNCGEEPAKPVRKTLQISASISQSKLVTILMDNSPEITLLFDTELDSASNTNKQDYGKISPELRKAYEFEPLGTHTHLHGDVQVNYPKLSVIVSGTEEQVGRFFVNKDDGLVSRFLNLFLPYRPYEGTAGYDGSSITNEEFWEKEIEPEVKWIVEYFQKKKLCLRMDNKLRSLYDDYFAQKEKEIVPKANDPYLSIVRRLRGILFRLCMVLAGMKAYEEGFIGTEYSISEEIAREVLSWADSFMEQSFSICDLIPSKEDEKSGKETKEDRYRKVFEALPCHFDMEQARNCGQTINGPDAKGYSESTVKRAIYWYIDHKLLQKSGKDNYHKVGCVEKPQPVLASEENDDDFPF